MNIFAQCMLNLKCSENSDVTLQVLSVLKMMAVQGYVAAQDEIYKLIHDRDSAFCDRVHMLLQERVTIFSESIARLVHGVSIWY